MPGTGSYSGPNVDSNYIYQVDDALYQLRNNSSNLIKPQDIRDSIWTLWNRVDDAQIIASQSLYASSGTTYTNSNPTTVSVGGIAIGSSFSATYSVQQMFDMLLYPYSRPTLSLSTSNTIRQFGSSTAVTLTWSVVKTKESITGITVDNASVVANGGNQNGTKATTATHSLTPLIQQVQTYSMSVVDASLNTTTKTATVTWQHKIYWGTVDLSTSATGGALNNPNLSLTPSSAVAVSLYIGASASLLINLTGAGISPGSALATTYARTYTGMIGGNKYLIFGHPTVFGASVRFFNGTQEINAFTKVCSSIAFVNESGFTTNYDIWISNTQYNSDNINLTIQ